MRNLRNIYLVGFMGTGKTSVGKALANELRFSFADIDDLIVQQEKRSISNIFAKDGEPYFRKLEKMALKKVSSKKGQVVSCGGGIILDPENIKVMKKTGKIICLSADPKIILERVKKAKHRPLLNVADPEAMITGLLKKRKACYAKADFSVDTSQLTIREVVEKIARF